MATSAWQWCTSSAAAVRSASALATARGGLAAASYGTWTNLRLRPLGWPADLSPELSPVTGPRMRASGGRGLCSRCCGRLFGDMAAGGAGRTRGDHQHQRGSRRGQHPLDASSTKLTFLHLYHSPVRHLLPGGGACAL